jgi:hypothetical protein
MTVFGRSLRFTGMGPVPGQASRLATGFSQAPPASEVPQCA